MTDKQEEDLVGIRDLHSQMRENYIEWTDFEHKYRQVKSEITRFIDKELDSNQKMLYNFKLNSIIAFESKAKGLNKGMAMYEMSIKTNASKRAKFDFESTFSDVKSHIIYDLDDFLESIPDEQSPDKSV